MMARCALLFALLASSAAQATRNVMLAPVAGAAPVPLITVDLDAPPASRWDAVVDVYNATMWASTELIAAIPEYAKLLAAANVAFEGAARPAWYPADQWDELVAIAARSRLPLGTLVGMNALYDVTAARKTSAKACAGVVARKADGSVIHGRNLDYPIARAMTNLTVRVRWTRGGAVAFESVSFVCQTGFNTLVKPGAFSITQNERDQGARADDWFDLFVRKRTITFAFLRQVAENATTYDEALGMLEREPLDADSYFIVAGPSDGAVVTRDRSGVANVTKLGDDGGWFLVETNYDSWTRPPFGDDRRAPARRHLEAIGPDAIDVAGLYAVLGSTTCDASQGERPVLNEETVYSAAFDPGATTEGGALSAVLRFPYASGNCTN